MPRAPAKPWSTTKASRRVLSPDERWAAEIRERVLADCHPFQRRAVEDPSRRYSMCIGRGGTKTTTFRARGILKVTSIRRAEVLYLATTKPHAKKLNWDKLEDANEFYGLELRFNKTELTATCARTGGIYAMSGMEDDADLERYRGYPFNEVQVDECASHLPERVDRLVYRIVGPRLGERNGCIGLGGTPGHLLRGLFYDVTRPGSPKHTPFCDVESALVAEATEGKRRGWSSHAWSLADVVSLPNAAVLYPALVANWQEALIEKEEEQWSDENPIWMREYLGLWAADDTDTVFRYRPHRDGQPWNQWDPFGDHKLEGIQQLRAAIAQLREMGLADLRYVVPADMGHTDPFALNVLAFSPTDPERRIFHVMAFERTGMYARQIAELVIGADAVERTLRNQPHEPLGGILGETGWPDAMVLDSDGAHIDELSKVYGIRFKKADRNPNYKHGAVELTNGDLVDGRLKILKGSQLEQQLQQLQWKEDVNGRVRENKAQANHSTDTLIYGRKEVAGLFEGGLVTTDAPPPSRPYADPQGLDAEPGGAAAGDRELAGMMSGAEFVDAWGNG